MFAANGPALADVRQRLHAAREHGQHFIAGQGGVPEVVLWDPTADSLPDNTTTSPAALGHGQYVITESDHCWHEFGDLVSTPRKPTDPRTLAQVITAVEEAARQGWQAFLPADRKPPA